MSERKYHKVDESMIIFAFRYNLGRKGDPVELCANYILALWQDLTPETKDQITREIDVFIERGDAGGEAEMLKWAQISLMRREELK